MGAGVIAQFGFQVNPVNQRTPFRLMHSVHCDMREQIAEKVYYGVFFIFLKQHFRNVSDTRLSLTRVTVVNEVKIRFVSPIL